MDGKHRQNGMPPNGAPANGHAPNAGPGNTGVAAPEKKEGGCCSCLTKVSSFITGGLETGFSKLGLSIGQHPVRYMVICILVAGLTGLGMLAFKEVSDPDKLWVPQDSRVVRDKEWVDTNYPSDVRREQIIAVASNILTPTGVKALLDIYQDADTVASGTTTLSDVCVRSSSNCLVYSILEIWSYDDTTIRSLTQDEIIDGVNTVTTSPLYNSPIDITTYLGKRTTNSSGSIVAAQAASMTWLTNGNDTMKSRTESWEEKLISIGKAGHADLSSTYVFAGRSWSDESGAAIEGDVMMLSIGYFLVIIFVFCVLGKLNFMEQRAWLTLGGFICVGLSILVSIGLSSAFQQAYGPLQSILPFLLLGIGVDDMFVIMGALNNLKPDEQKLDIPTRMSLVLRHAGVSITVTSFTDFMAFMIGATTIIPALKSFCIYAGIGVLALYLLQAIFFTACLTVDLYRIESDRDGCLCCIKHPSPPYQANACSQKQLIPYVFKHGLARIIIKLPFQIVAVVIAAALFGVNIYGLVNLEQYFDPNWFLPSDSYAFKYGEATEKYFPDDGTAGYVYCGNINYWSHQTELEAMDTALSNSKYIYNGTTDSWFAALTGWLSTTTDATVTAYLDANDYPDSEASFINLTYKMKTEIYQRTNSYLNMDSNTDILASRFPFRHIAMDDAATQIAALDETRALVENAGFATSECFPYVRRYITWETNKIIREELFRNLGLALLCVFVVTLILIANIRTSIFVFGGVLFTLVDVAGTMHFWGLTIDTVTSIILILSIGLAVDYSAHIGHMFMTINGDKTERLKETIGEMGPPVFYGGFSTFLAFVLLAGSNSYVFTTFFKVNFLVVLYGLFHGLIVIPVLLRWFGPEPYASADREFRHHHRHAHDDATGHPIKDQGLSNPAFTTWTSPNKIEGGPGREMRPMSNHSNGSLSPPPSQGSRKTSTPPPDYDTDDIHGRNMPSVHM